MRRGVIQPHERQQLPTLHSERIRSCAGHFLLPTEIRPSRGQRRLVGPRTQRSSPRHTLHRAHGAPTGSCNRIQIVARGYQDRVPKSICMRDILNRIHHLSSQERPSGCLVLWLLPLGVADGIAWQLRVGHRPRTRRYVIQVGISCCVADVRRFTRALRSPALPRKVGTRH